MLRPGSPAVTEADPLIYQLMAAWLLVLVDSNVLLYAINDDAQQHRAAARALKELANGDTQWALTWSVIYEFLRVATHPRALPAPLTFHRAWQFIDSLLELDSCVALRESPQHRQVLVQCANEAPRVSGDLVHDLRHAALMREHGIDEIVTYDADFRSFSWVAVVLPEA